MCRGPERKAWEKTLERGERPAVGATAAVDETREGHDSRDRVFNDNVKEVFFQDHQLAADEMKNLRPKGATRPIMTPSRRRSSGPSRVSAPLVRQG